MFINGHLLSIFVASILILMRVFYCCLLFLFAAYRGAAAVQDSTVFKQQVQPAGTRADAAFIPFVDSVALAKAYRRQFTVDSIVMAYLRPDLVKQREIIAATAKIDLTDLAFKPLKIKEKLFKGKSRRLRDPWILIVVIALIGYTALLNLFLGNEIKSILYAFYNNNALSQTEKESGLINSWAFIGLFILFCFSLGLLLYQLTVYYGVNYTISGFRLFLAISVVAALLFIFKFFVLKLIGFLFDTGMVVSEYISVVNLTYFNIAFVLLAVIVCFSLIAERFVPALLTVTLSLVIIIFAWQYLRNTVSMAANFRFHKFYLFIYLCALEICPVLVLIKAVRL